VTEVAWRFLAGATGACVGSFLNVVIWRLPRGESLSRPRSRCPRCAAPIRWFDNVPVLSWLWLRARCRRCRAPISARYPLVEAATAALFLLVASRHAPADGGGAVALAATEAVFLAALLAITFIDLDHRIIPDRITKPGMAIACLLALLVPGLHSATFLPEVTNRRLAGLLEAVAGLLVGGGVILLVRWIGTKALKKEAMGLGDAKLLAMIGALTSPVRALYALLLASLSGAVLGAFAVYARTRRPAPVAGTLAVEGGADVEFARARVRPDRLWIATRDAVGAGARVRVRMTLPADAIWEDEDAKVSLRGVVESAAARRGGALVVVRLDEPSAKEADALEAFALIRRYIPFGPFLALGGALVLLHGDEISRFVTETWPRWLRGAS
jgi:leader peptidase (prepilin peptidase)/N-methyltransferase